MLLAVILALVAQSAASAAPAPSVDGAGNRMEALAPVGAVPAPGSAEAELRSGRYCTPGSRYPRWCAEVRREGADAPWQMLVSFHRSPMSDVRPRIFTPADDDGRTEYEVWPHIVLEPGGGALLGLIATRRAAYSDGGAMAARLTLLRTETGSRDIIEVLQVPDEGSAMIRACFSEADSGARRGACHDEYRFSASLTLERDAPPGAPPRFRFETEARTYPGRVSRTEDSTERGPLREDQLAWWQDPVCSYRRSFALDPAQGRYAADAPLPECADYLDVGD